MLRYRPFRNSDPPALAAIWRSRAGQCGLLQPVSVDLFEQLVFGKVYFDYTGLFMAFDQGRPVGFAHAAFGPNEQKTRISTEMGVICIIMVRPDCPQAEVARGLLEQCEKYLVGQGAKVLFGGAIYPVNPFYLGLYGGSQLPGVLNSDTIARELYQLCGYREVDQILVFRRDLDGYRPPLDRQQMQIRRRMIVEVKIDPPARDWWEACTIGDFDLTRFELFARGDNSRLASVIVRDMQSTGTSHPRRAAGLLDVSVDPDHRRQGLGTFLLGESFRQLAHQGVALVEGQVPHGNTAGAGLFRKLGLEQVDEGAVFRKDVT